MTEKIIISQDSDGLKRALDHLKIKIRWNITDDAYEWSLPQDPNQGWRPWNIPNQQWRPMKKNDSKWLRDKISKEFVFQSGKIKYSAFFYRSKWRVAFGAYMAENRYDQTGPIIPEKEENLTGQWLAECGSPDPENFETSSDLQKSWSEWIKKTRPVRRHGKTIGRKIKRTRIERRPEANQ